MRPPDDFCGPRWCRKSYPESPDSSAGLASHTTQEKIGGFGRSATLKLGTFVKSKGLTKGHMLLSMGLRAKSTIADSTFVHLFAWFRYRRTPGVPLSDGGGG